MKNITQSAEKRFRAVEAHFFKFFHFGTFESKLGLGLLILALAIGVYRTSLAFYESKYDEITGPLIRADSRMTEGIKRVNADILQVNRMKNQVEIIHQKKTHHLNVSRMFYKYYYANSMLLTIFTSLTLMATFLLIKIGWDSKHHHAGYIRVLFMSCSFIATTILGYIQVYGQRENVRHNMHHYFVLEKLQLEVYTQLNLLPADTADFTEKNWNRLDSAFIHVNKNLQNTLGLYLDIDTEKVPSRIGGTENF